jgi:hypothetical protein
VTGEAARRLGDRGVEAVRPGFEADVLGEELARIIPTP